MEYTVFFLNHLCAYPALLCFACGEAPRGFIFPNACGDRNMRKFATRVSINNNTYTFFNKMKNVKHIAQVLCQPKFCKCLLPRCQTFFLFFKVVLFNIFVHHCAFRGGFLWTLAAFSPIFSPVFVSDLYQVNVLSTHNEIFTEKLRSDNKPYALALW